MIFTLFTLVLFMQEEPCFPNGRTSTAPIDKIPYRFGPAERIIACGDLHGDFEVTQIVLRHAGLIDENDRWIGGKTVFVQVGDQLDRGDSEVAIFRLFKRLEKESRKAGGAVHILLGNHELRNANLDFTDVTPGGFKDFTENVPCKGSVPKNYPLEQRARVCAFRPGGSYNRILCERNSILMIGNNVFVHGGVLPQYLKYGIQAYNSDVRYWIKKGQLPDCLLENGDSPHWSRLYSNLDPTVYDPEVLCATLKETLRGLGAKRMVVGHSVQTFGLNNGCEGRVWRIDTGMTEYYQIRMPEILREQNLAVMLSTGITKPSYLEILGNDARVHWVYPENYGPSESTDSK